MTKQQNLPSAKNLTKDEYKQKELRLRVVTPIRDKWTDPNKKDFLVGHTGHGNVQNTRGDSLRLQVPALLPCAQSI